MRAPDPIAADLAAIDAALAGRPHDEGDPALAELGLLVRDTRPLPDDPRARRIDSRVAQALRAPARAGRRRPAWLMPALGTCASLLVLVVIVVSAAGGGHGGTTGGGGGSTAGPAIKGGNEAAGPQAAGSGGSSSSSANPGPSAAGGVLVQPGAPDRAVERSASMRIGVRPDRLDSAAAGAARVATGLGGYVAASSVTEGQGASLDLRVPSARVDQAVERLSQLGKVRDLQRSTLDITDQLTAARRRVEEYRAERRSLLRQLANAATRREAERIRARLATVTRRLDRARAEVAQLRNRAGNATISVAIVPERRHGGAAASHPWTPGDALRDAARVLEVAAGVALVALAVALPIGLIGVPAWIAARILARRRREHALDLA